MAIKLIQVHKTENGFIQQGEQEFLKRIKRFISLDIETIQHGKKWNLLPPIQVKEKEGEKILSKCNPTDYLLLLDEKGKQYSSKAFALQLEQLLSQGNIVFVIGGAYGFSSEVYARANAKLSMSLMTTSHQLIRLLFLEQLYRAFTILHNHPYHNE